jgi:hypothetical protein
VHHAGPEFDRGANVQQTGHFAAAGGFGLPHRATIGPGLEPEAYPIPETGIREL